MYCIYLLNRNHQRCIGRQYSHFCHTTPIPLFVHLPGYVLAGYMYRNYQDIKRKHRHTARILGVNTAAARISGVNKEDIRISGRNTGIQYVSGENTVQKLTSWGYTPATTGDTEAARILRARYPNRELY